MSLHLEQAAPPPPSDVLRAHITRGGAVQLRRPLRDAVVWTLAAAVVAVASIALFGVRRDLVGVDARWLVLGIAWLLVSVTAGVAATIPPTGQVLPSTTRARWIAGGSMGLLALATAALAYDRAQSTHYAGLATLHGIGHCCGLGLVMAAPLVGLSWALVIRRVPVGAPLVGAALGAAAGALSGFVLHTVCAVGGATHALLGHVGGLALGAALGAASSLFNRR